MDAKFIEKALVELREDEPRRTQSLEQFREWLAKHSFLNTVRQDDVHLSQFLRVRKFNMIEAFKTFEKFHLTRKNFPEVVDFSDENMEKMRKLFDTGYCVPLTDRDDEGRRIILLRVKFWDTEIFSQIEIFRLILFVTLTLLEEEETQIAGISFIADLSGMTTSHLFSIGLVTKIINLMTNCLPVRFKDLYFVNLPALAKIIFDFFVSRVKEKLSSRFITVNSPVDMVNYFSEKILPLEYGGFKDVEEMKKIFWKILEERKEKVLETFCKEIDWSKFAEGSLNEKIDEGAGSFRKLEID